MKRLAGFALCLLAMSAGGATAQDLSVSYSTWIIAGNMVTLRFLLPVSEARRLMGVAVPVLTTNKLEDYLLQHEAVQSAGGECPAIDQGFDLGRVDPLAVGPDLYGFEIFFRCRDPRQLLLRNTALFGQSAEHVNFARVQVRGQSVEQLFTAQQQQLSIPDDGAVPAARFTAYLRLGVRHVLAGTDRWIFLLGALLLVSVRRELGYLIAALVGGYVLSLLVVSGGWVMPRVLVLEAFMGFLVALLGVTIMQGELKNDHTRTLRWPTALLLVILAAALLRAPSAAFALLGGAALSSGLLTFTRWSKGRPTVWPGLVATFTFLDGFALPAVLAPAQLSPSTQTRILLGFDLGAVLIAVVLLGVALAVWRLLRGQRLLAVRPVINDVCAAGLCGLGAFWLLTRLG